VVQFCALCGETIEAEGNIATIYFEITGIGAFELNTHAECLVQLGEPDHIKNGAICILCGDQDTDSCFLVRQLENLYYPVHTFCLEELLEHFASLFSDKVGDSSPHSESIFSENEDEDYRSHIGLVLFESRN